MPDACTNRKPGYPLYGDDLHANEPGSYLAALVMYARIFNKSPVGLPAVLRTQSGVTITLSPETALVLQQATADIALAATPAIVPSATPVITSRC